MYLSAFFTLQVKNILYSVSMQYHFKNALCSGLLSKLYWLLLTNNKSWKPVQSISGFPKDMEVAAPLYGFIISILIYLNIPVIIYLEEIKNNSLCEF